MFRRPLRRLRRLINYIKKELEYTPIVDPEELTKDDFNYQSIEFLNSQFKGSTAHIAVKIHSDGYNIKISDCSSLIELHNSYYDSESSYNAIFKLAKLEHEAKQARRTLMQYFDENENDYKRDIFIKNFPEIEIIDSLIKK